MTFEPIIERVHPADPNGEQKVFRFPNGLGASVVRSYFSYGTPDLWELGVIRFTGADTWQLVYSTPVTDDVLGHLTWEDVEARLAEIAALPKDEGTDDRHG